MQLHIFLNNNLHSLLSIQHQVLYFRYFIRFCYVACIPCIFPQIRKFSTKAQKSAIVDFHVSAIRITRLDISRQQFANLSGCSDETETKTKTYSRVSVNVLKCEDKNVYLDLAISSPNKLPDQVKGRGVYSRAGNANKGLGDMSLQKTDDSCHCQQVLSMGSADL